MDRVVKVNKHTLLGAGGEISDFQYIQVCELEASFAQHALCESMCVNFACMSLSMCALAYVCIFMDACMGQRMARAPTSVCSCMCVQ